jgi:hypothetical protein
VKALPRAKVEYDGVFEPNDDRENGSQAMGRRA